MHQTFKQRLQRIAGDIELAENFAVEIGNDGVLENHYYLQIKCWRKDIITGEMSWGYGGKSYPSPEAPEGNIIKTIFSLYLGYVEHEARETFRWKGRRIFGPHISSEALWHVAQQVDVRKDAPTDG